MNTSVPTAPGRPNSRPLGHVMNLPGASAPHTVPAQARAMRSQLYVQGQPCDNTITGTSLYPSLVAPASPVPCHRALCQGSQARALQCSSGGPSDRERQPVAGAKTRSGRARKHQPRTRAVTPPSVLCQDNDMQLGARATKLSSAMKSTPVKTQLPKKKFHRQAKRKHQPSARATTSTVLLSGQEHQPPARAVTIPCPPAEQ